MVEMWRSAAVACQLQGFGSWPGRSLLDALLISLLFSSEARMVV
jgi:hypothetical protein